MARNNWEISGLACSILYKPILSVMRHFDNPKLGDYILSRRRQFRQTLQDKKSALKPLLKALKSHQAVGMLCDQHAGSLEGVETVFFGHPARTHASPALLHLKTGAPIIL